ncbi:hypothetical protein D9619_012070 [Psilocybe cf. subviscida]|uniref:Feruloyl esterase C n=1 Tax=Psilocybe cf. subviscida TaxID=2480587 RepID=A0A8H5EZ64_9AGAR|nr:hypothetical protein D9619_012070 [Psilocybe cf. subviscida]
MPLLQGTVAGTAGCGKSPLASGTRTVSGRQYILQVPSNYDSNKEYKLIFGFHWRGGSMNDVAPGYYGLRALAGETAIFVAPNGIDSGWANTNNRDNTFVDSILSEVKSNLCVDEKQVFATGWSYGGSMSYNLACSKPTVFRSVSVISGAQLSGCTGGETKIPYLGIHGVVDSVLNISNGRSLRDRFLRVNGCASKNAPEPSPGSDSTYIKTEYSCSPGFPVWWIAHGGDHVGSPSSGANWMAQQTWDFWTRAINVGSSSTTTSLTTTQSTTSAPTTTTTSSGNCAARWGQCGGQGWSGATIVVIDSGEFGLKFS